MGFFLRPDKAYRGNTYAGDDRFVANFHKLGIQAQRVINARDVVPTIPGLTTLALKQVTLFLAAPWLHGAAQPLCVCGQERSVVDDWYHWSLVPCYLI